MLLKISISASSGIFRNDRSIFPASDQEQGEIIESPSETPILLQQTRFCLRKSLLSRLLTADCFFQKVEPSATAERKENRDPYYKGNNLQEQAYCFVCTAVPEEKI
jgi:hypothetical protein